MTLTADANTELAQLTKKAETGDVEAQYNLALLYFGGSLGEQNFSECYKWMRKAADQGFEKAEQSLGLAYEEGYGVEPNFAEAAKWYRVAAKKGNLRSQGALATLYFHGLGVEQSYGESYFWFMVSFKCGSHPERIQREQPDGETASCELAASHLTSEQKAELDKRVREWEPISARKRIGFI